MELRKDYILDRWVIIATDRKKRKIEFHRDGKKKDHGTCFFCPGNEHLTPPEIGRFPQSDAWKIRWFPNKFPAVEKKGNPNIQTHNDFFTFANAFGYHEVIAETPDHEKQLWDLPKEDLTKIYSIYKHRVEELEKLENIKYVLIFKNHGAQAGTSLIHSHTQVAAVSFLPKSIRDESEKSRDDCPYCRIINIEKNSFRKCFENSLFVAFAPYASRFNYEIWVFPKEHLRTFSDFDYNYLEGLGDIMHKILTRLKSVNMPYNYYVHYSPKQDNLHFHIEIIPRMSIFAGFEYASQTVINSVSPEDAARFYRNEE